MNIPINIELKDYIKAYILCLNPLLKLKLREIDLIEAMIKVYMNLNKEVISGKMTEQEVDERMFDTMGRKVTADLIKMSRESYNNHFFQLKKKSIITNDNKLHPFLKLNSTKPIMNINYEFKIKVSTPNKATLATQIAPAFQTA